MALSLTHLWQTNSDLGQGPFLPPFGFRYTPRRTLLVSPGTGQHDSTHF